MAEATEASHLLGHSFGGLVARAAVLGGYAPASLTLLSSGPAALPGARAEELHSLLNYLDGTPTLTSRARSRRCGTPRSSRQAVAAGVAAPIVAFLEERMLGNNPTGLVTMAAQLLKARGQDRRPGRAGPSRRSCSTARTTTPGRPTQQQDMAARLNAERTCIPAAAHNPNVEAPATTAHALTTFWNAAER